jgi:hypothetical protein
MSNAPLTVKQAQTIISKTAAAMFKDKCQFLNTIDTEPDSTFKGANGYMAGDTINIAKPARFSMNTTADITSAIQDIEEDKVALALSRQRNVPVAMTSAEIATDLALKDWMKRVLEPAITTLSNGIEAECLGDVADLVGNSVGTPGSNPFDTDTMLTARELLSKNLCPYDDKRFALLDSGAMRKATNARKGLFQSSSEIASQYKNGYVGQADGFTYLENNLLPTHTNGNDVTGVTVKTTVSTAGQATLVVQGLTNTTGTVTKGSVITIDGVFAVHPVTGVAYDHLQQFIVLNNETADGSGDATLDLYPAFYTSTGRKSVSAYPQANAAVTFVGTASQSTINSVAYHKSAFRFVSAPLVLPNGVHMASQERVDGVSIRTIQDYTVLTDKLVMRIDVLYGFTAVRPEWAVRLPN